MSNYDSIALALVAGVIWWSMHRKAEDYREELAARTRIIALEKELRELRCNTAATRT